MQEVDRHTLTTAALRARHERGEHGDGCVERGHDVDDRNARLEGVSGGPVTLISPPTACTSGS